MRATDKYSQQQRKSGVEHLPGRWSNPPPLLVPYPCPHCGRPLGKQNDVNRNNNNNNNEGKHQQQATAESQRIGPGVDQAVLPLPVREGVYMRVSVSVCV